MFRWRLVPLLTLVVAVCAAPPSASSQPNIVFILADDLGYNDAPWHNPDILAPRLEQLAREGVILEQSYVQPLCTPSRAALLTGKYPFHMGRQLGCIMGLQPTGLSINYTLLPELLSANGYSTHMIGKWHLGSCAPEYLPLARGFDTFFGFWAGASNYYNHSLAVTVQDPPSFDYWDQEEMVALKYQGQYSTDLFSERAAQVIRQHDQSKPMFMYLPFQSPHIPLQVPQKYEDMYPDVEDDDRRVFMGMVTNLDDAVGNVVDALKDSGMYNNTVIVFVSDNGGWPPHGGNNYPLRGQKLTIWEGGTRTPAFVHSPLLERSGYTSHELIHMTDWLPTFLHLAGASGAPAGGDGFNQWDAISRGESSSRDELVYNMDKNGPIFDGALRVGEMKLVWGPYNAYVNNSGWYPPPGSQAPLEEPVEVGESTEDVDEILPWGPLHLFNLTADPTEHVNLAQEMPETVRQLKERAKQLLEEMVPADYPPNDPAGEAVDGVWITGWCTPH